MPKKKEKQESFRPPLPVDDLTLESLQLLAEDGVEEPLVRWPKAATETRLRIALPPDARYVTVRAVARSRHATVSMYRCHDAAAQPLQRTAEVLHLTARKDAPKPTTHEKACAIAIQTAVRRWMRRRRFLDAIAATRAAKRAGHALNPRLAPMPRSANYKPTPLQAASALARAAFERYNRADGLHRTMQAYALGATAKSAGKGGKAKAGAAKKGGGKGGGFGGKAGAPPRLAFAPLARALLMMEHRTWRGGRPLAEPTDGVSSDLKAFLAANILPLSALLASLDEDETGLIDQPAFEEVLYELGLPRTAESTAELALLYDAIGVHPSVRSGKIRYADLKHSLLPRVAETCRDVSRRLTLWGATDKAPASPRSPRSKSPQKGKRSKSPPKAGDKKGKKVLSPEEMAVQALRAQEVALPVEREAAIRIIVTAEDCSFAAYTLHVTIAPTDWPQIPEPSAETTPIIADLLKYYGERIPPIGVPLCPYVHTLTPPSSAWEANGGSAALVYAGELRPKVLPLAQRQGAAVMAGHANFGEDAMEIERFVACCSTLGLAAPAVSRLAFAQACRERPGALLGPQRVWHALFFAFVRALSLTPNAAKPPHRWVFEPAAIVAALMATLVPLHYNRAAASTLSGASRSGGSAGSLCGGSLCGGSAGSLASIPYMVSSVLAAYNLERLTFPHAVSQAAVPLLSPRGPLGAQRKGRSPRRSKSPRGKKKSPKRKK